MDNDILDDSIWDDPMGIRSRRYAFDNAIANNYQDTMNRLEDNMSVEGYLAIIPEMVDALASLAADKEELLRASINLQVECCYFLSKELNERTHHKFRTIRGINIITSDGDRCTFLDTSIASFTGEQWQDSGFDQIHSDLPALGLSKTAVHEIARNMVIRKNPPSRARRPRRPPPPGGWSTLCLVEPTRNLGVRVTEVTPIPEQDEEEVVNRTPAISEGWL